MEPKTTEAAVANGIIKAVLALLFLAFALGVVYRSCSGVIESYK